MHPSNSHQTHSIGGEPIPSIISPHGAAILTSWNCHLILKCFYNASSLVIHIESDQNQIPDSSVLPSSDLIVTKWPRTPQGTSNRFHTPTFPTSRQKLLQLGKAKQSQLVSCFHQRVLQSSMQQILSAGQLNFMGACDQEKTHLCQAGFEPTHMWGTLVHSSWNRPLCHSTNQIGLPRLPKWISTLFKDKRLITLL